MLAVRAGENRRGSWVRNRRGTILVLSAALMVMIFAFVAFSVDVGYIALTRAKLQNNADAAALAAALEMSGLDDPAVVRANARKAALEVVIANVNNKPENANFDPEMDVQFGKQTYDSVSKTYKFQWGDQYFPYNVVKVFGRRTSRDPKSSNGKPDQRLPLFFAPVMGIDHASVNTEAIATFQPRDIMVVLDFSASMRYDSLYSAIGKLGRPAVEANLKQMYAELGSPVYGKLTLPPSYAAYSGVPKAGTTPHIDVSYRGTSVEVSSTSGITSVRLQFDSGSTETLSSSVLNGLISTVKGLKTGVISGTGGNSSKVITSVWVKSGGNANLSSGKYGEQFDFSTTGLKKALGLDTVKFPYPAGSWDEFIEYCTDEDTEIDDAGYRFKFGYMNWMNYRQDYYPGANETPDLWKTNELPTGILKDGVDLFVDYLKATDASDRLGLSVYTHTSSAGAILETGLTNDVTLTKTITRQRQAGHYDPYTNIGAGMKLAREELEKNARKNAHRLMVVMTDGVANKPSNTTQAKAFVLQEAQAAKASKIQILTISMGALADTNLMQQVADTSDGVHFNVPGGSSISEYQKQLNDVFKQVAASRKPKLIGESK